MYLAHEPLLVKYREFKSFMKKVKRSISRGEVKDARRREQTKPRYTLDHIIKERYPTFQDALADLEDALCMVHLFSMLPSESQTIRQSVTAQCLKLCREWQNYVCESRSLRKVFVSIKGIYYQAEVGFDLAVFCLQVKKAFHSSFEIHVATVTPFFISI
jgi:pescadillo protein